MSTKYTTIQYNLTLVVCFEDPFCLNDSCMLACVNKF